jgi:hypothetical protein
LILLLLPESRSAFVNFLSARPDMTTTVYGLLEIRGALADARMALTQGAVVAAALIGILLLAGRRTLLAGCLLIVLSATDLGLAHAPLMYTVPRSVFESEPLALAKIRDASSKNPSQGPFRIHRQANWAPSAWLAGGSPHRLEEITRWERDSLRPKYAITEGPSYTYTRGTAELSDVIPFFDSYRIQLDPETCRRNGFPEGYQVVYFTRRGFDLWNARYFILPARLAFRSRFRGVLSFLPRTTEIDPPPGTFDGPDGGRLRESWLRDSDVQILRNEAAFPRAWIVHRARFPDPNTARNLADRQRLMDELLYQDDELWHVEGKRVHDPRATAWLEVDAADRSSIAHSISGAPPDPSETVTFDEYRPDRVTLTAQLNSAGLVVLADVYYPGWELAIDGNPSRIFRTNRAMRGALVPAGTHRLVYSYRPVSLKVGAILSVLGMCVFGALLLPRRRNVSLMDSSLTIISDKEVHM